MFRKPQPHTSFEQPEFDEVQHLEKMAIVTPPSSVFRGKTKKEYEEWTQQRIAFEQSCGLTNKQALDRAYKLVYTPVAFWNWFQKQRGRTFFALPTEVFLYEHGVGGAHPSGPDQFACWVYEGEDVDSKKCPGWLSWLNSLFYEKEYLLGESFARGISYRDVRLIVEKVLGK